MVLKLISGMVKDVGRHVYGSIKEVWLESGNDGEAEFILSPVAVKERSSRTPILRV